MSEVRIFVDGIERTMTKQDFTEILEAAEMWCNQESFNNLKRDNVIGYNKWFKRSERVYDLDKCINEKEV